MMQSQQSCTVWIIQIEDLLRIQIEYGTELGNKGNKSLDSIHRSMSKPDKTVKSLKTQRHEATPESEQRSKMTSRA